jgi:hypothetical protein
MAPSCEHLLPRFALSNPEGLDNSKRKPKPSIGGGSLLAHLTDRPKEIGKAGRRSSQSEHVSTCTPERAASCASRRRSKMFSRPVSARRSNFDRGRSPESRSFDAPNALSSSPPFDSEESNFGPRSWNRSASYAPCSEP